MFIAKSSVSQIVTLVAGGGTGGSGSPATSTSIYNPNGMVFDAYGNLYFCSNLGHKVQKINTDGILITVAGTGSPGYSGDGGMAISAKLNQPTDIAIDINGNLLISDAANCRIRKIDIVSGIITTIAGDGTFGYGGDGGLATLAKLNQPSSICTDEHGSIYISDYGNYRIRKINNLGVIGTFAGNGIPGWGGDGGHATNARCSPQACIRLDKYGNLYVAEWGNKVLRRINNTGIIETIAGDTSSYIHNGDNVLANNSHLAPGYVVINKSGDIYVSDINNNRIRVITTDGIINTVAGNGIGSSTGDGNNAKDATVHWPSGLALDSCENLFFGQVNTPRIRKISFNPDCLLTSIKDLSTLHEENVKLSPSPTRGEVTVDGKVISSVRVCNMVGQMVYEYACKKAEKVTVNISHLPQGVYMVRVNDVWVGKVVKE